MTTAPMDDDRSGVTSEQLRRLGGLALMVALPLQVLGFLLHPPTEELRHVLEASYGASHLILWVSWVLAMLGLPTMYAAQAQRAGKLGLIAFVGTMGAAAYHLYLTLYEASAIPAAATQPGADALVGDGGALAHGAGALGPVAMVLLLAFPLMGVVTLRARVFPRPAGWLQVACVPVFLVLMLGIGAVTGGAVGPDADTWFGGMLPIASLYWVLFAGYALAGRVLRSHAAPGGVRVRQDSALASASR